VAYVVTSILVGWAVDRSHSYAGPALAIGLAVVPGAIAWLLWEPRRRLTAPATAP
jgi:hypothetical protein